MQKQRSSCLETDPKQLAHMDNQNAVFWVTNECEFVTGLFNAGKLVRLHAAAWWVVKNVHVDISVDGGHSCALTCNAI